MRSRWDATVLRSSASSAWSPSESSVVHSQAGAASRSRRRPAAAATGLGRERRGASAARSSSGETWGSVSERSGWLMPLGFAAAADPPSPKDDDGPPRRADLRLAQQSLSAPPQYGHE